MRSRTGLAAALLVLAGGVGAALCFRTSSPAAIETIEPLDAARRHLDEGPRFLMEVRSTAPQWPEPREPQQSPPEKVEPLVALSGLPLFEAQNDFPPRISQQYPLTEEPLPPWIQHRVVDGDTLASLAKRYLKDASRAPEILDSNRDVLTDPDLLPIGLQLRIPRR